MSVCQPVTNFWVRREDDFIRVRNAQRKRIPNMMKMKTITRLSPRWLNWWWRCWSGGSRWGKRRTQHWSVLLVIAIHMPYTCHTYVIHMSYICRTHVIHMSYTCHTYVIHIMYDMCMLISCWYHTLRLTHLTLSASTGWSTRGGLAAARPSTGGNGISQFHFQFFHSHFHFLIKTSQLTVTKSHFFILTFTFHLNL